MVNSPNFSSHAKKRLVQRGISEDDVLTALSRPLGPPQAGDGGNLAIDGYSREGKVLRVILNADQDVVVSAMWRSR